MGIKMQNKIKKRNGSVVIMPKIFENCIYDFGDFKISIEYVNNELELGITSDTLDMEEVKEIYWDFYSYLNILLGYYPVISENTFMSKAELENIADQFRTKECYIRASEQYIKSMDIETFKKSFIAFRKVNKKASFQLSMFNVSMMESVHYPEIAVINLLQSLDGLYEELFSNKSNNSKIRKQKLNYVKNTLNSIDIENINDNEYENIKGYMQKISDITFIDKLRLMTTLTKYDVFKYEKELNECEKYSFEKIMNKFVNTRNKFSHSINKKDVLSGTESAVYIFKIIMLYRLLIFEKIGISSLIDEEEFLNNLKEWDTYISSTLKKEEEMK